MNTTPKIIVLKTREIIYTLLLLFLVALLIVCLILMFAPKSGETGQVRTQSTGSPQTSQGQTAETQNRQTQNTQTAETQNRQTQSTQAAETQNRQMQSTQTAEAQNRQSQNTQTAETQNRQPQNTQTAETQNRQSQTPQPQTVQTANAQFPQQAVSAMAQSRYTPGIYTAPVMLGESAVDVEVTVDENRISSIRLVNLSETTAAAFPLVSPSLDHIAEQILENQSLDNITCPGENKYTSQLLLSAVSAALAIAGTK